MEIKQNDGNKKDVAMFIDVHNIEYAIQKCQDKNIGNSIDRDFLTHIANSYGRLVIGKAYFNLGSKKETDLFNLYMKHSIEPIHCIDFGIDREREEKGNLTIRIDNLLREIFNKTPAEEYNKIKEELTRIKKFISDTKSSKSLADPMLITDCMETLFQNPSISTYIIVGMDKDYIPLMRKLAEKGKEVVVIGIEKSSSQEFIADCYRLGKFYEYTTWYKQYLEKIEKE